MNTTAKVFQGQYASVRIFSWLTFASTRYQWVLNISLMFVLFSALATVMTTSKSRYYYRQLQSYHQQQVQAEFEHGRLLLERGTLLAQARVAEVAGSKAGMGMPSQKMLVVVD